MSDATATSAVTMRRKRCEDLHVLGSEQPVRQVGNSNRLATAMKESPVTLLRRAKPVARKTAGKAYLRAKKLRETHSLTCRQGTGTMPWRCQHMCLYVFIYVSDVFLRQGLSKMFRKSVWPGGLPRTPVEISCRHGETLPKQDFSACVAVRRS